jgi:hypothetical protein
MPSTICDNMSSEDTWMMPQMYFAYWIFDHEAIVANNSKLEIIYLELLSFGFPTLSSWPFANVLINE